MRSENRWREVGGSRVFASRRYARIRVALIGIALCLASGFGIGCSDPDRVILASMDATEEARFRRGRAIAVPCWTCHDLAGQVKKVGPSLQGLYGRRSGTLPGYESSPAMQAASIVWDDRMLGAFLSNPGGFVPGNRMVSPGLRDAGAMADLLFYLRHVTPPSARSERAD